MSTVTQDVGPASWTPINIWAFLRNLVNNNVPVLTNAGVPTSGTSGTFAGQAGPGCILIDTTNGANYINTGTLASPIWTLDVGNNGSGGSVSALTTITGSISSTNITGTASGQLGNANGVVLVPAASAKAVNRLVSATIAMDFATAAYTGGGNTTVNISGGGAALTGLVNTTTFIQAASDIIIDLVPLAATNNSYGTGANGLALVTSVAPTNPGTAAGVIKFSITYQNIPAIID